MTQRPLVSSEYNGLPAAVRAQQQMAASNAAADRFSSRLDVPRLAATQHPGTAVGCGPMTRPATESDSSSIESQKESGYHSNSSFGFASDTTAVNIAAAVIVDGPEHSFVRGETYTEKYLADEARGDLVQALRHIDKAIECYQHALTAASLSSDSQVRLRLKYNTAILRSRHLHKRLSALPPAAHAKPSDEAQKATQAVDRRTYRQSTGQAAGDRIGKYDARVDRRNTVVNEMRSAAENDRIVRSDARKTADSRGSYERDTARLGEFKPRNTDRYTINEYQRDREAFEVRGNDNNYRNPGVPSGRETAGQESDYQYCNSSLGRREMRDYPGRPTADTVIYSACGAGDQVADVRQHGCTASSYIQQRNVGNVIGTRPQSAERRLENNCASSRTEYDNRRLDSLGRRRDRHELQCAPREFAEHESRKLGTRANCVPLDNTCIMYREANVSPCRGRPDNHRRTTSCENSRQDLDPDTMSPHRELSATNDPNYAIGRSLLRTPADSLPLMGGDRGRSVQQLDFRPMYDPAGQNFLLSTPRKAAAPPSIPHARYISDISAVEATYRQMTTNDALADGSYPRPQQRAADGRPPRPCTVSRDKPPAGPPRTSRQDSSSAAAVTASPRGDDIPSGPYQQLVLTTPKRVAKGVEMYATLPRKDVTPRRCRQNADDSPEAAAAASGGDYSCRSLPRTPDKRLPLSTVSASRTRGPRVLNYYAESPDTGRTSGRSPPGYARDTQTAADLEREVAKNSSGSTKTEQWGEDCVQITWC